MKIEVLLTELEIAQEFSEAMHARDLPEKFFYWFPLSVQAWTKVAAEPDYAALMDAWGSMAAKIGTATAALGDMAPVISFGAGDASKDMLLLRALKDVGREVRYYPVDASQALLELATAAAEEDDIECLGIKADISSPMHLLLASDIVESPKVLVMAGNTIGAFDPLEQILEVAKCMHNGDLIILDAEIARDDSLERHNHPALRDFLFAPLATIGITNEDGEVKIERKRDDRRDGLHLITRHFRAARDLRAIVDGREIPIERNERISMNFQYVFAPEAFRWLIEQHAGLKIREAVASPDGRFALAVCAK